MVHYIIIHVALFAIVDSLTIILKWGLTSLDKHWDLSTLYIYIYYQRALVLPSTVATCIKIFHLLYQLLRTTVSISNHFKKVFPEVKLILTACTIGTCRSRKWARTKIERKSILLKGNVLLSNRTGLQSSVTGLYNHWLLKYAPVRVWDCFLWSRKYLAENFS